MSAFCVFGMTKTAAKALAQQQFDRAWPGLSEEERKRFQNDEDVAREVAARAELLLVDGASRQVSPPLRRTSVRSGLDNPRHQDRWGAPLPRDVSRGETRRERQPAHQQGHGQAHGRLGRLRGADVMAAQRRYSDLPCSSCTRLPNSSISSGVKRPGIRMIRFCLESSGASASLCTNGAKRRSLLITTASSGRVSAPISKTSRTVRKSTLSRASALITYSMSSPFGCGIAGSYPTSSRVSVFRDQPYRLFTAPSLISFSTWRIAKFTASSDELAVGIAPSLMTPSECSVTIGFCPQTARPLKRLPPLSLCAQATIFIPGTGSTVRSPTFSAICPPSLAHREVERVRNTLLIDGGHRPNYGRRYLHRALHGMRDIRRDHVEVSRRDGSIQALGFNHRDSLLVTRLKCARPHFEAVNNTLCHSRLHEISGSYLTKLEVSA